MYVPPASFGVPVGRYSMCGPMLAYFAGSRLAPDVGRLDDVSVDVDDAAGCGQRSRWRSAPAGRLPTCGTPDYRYIRSPVQRRCIFNTGLTLKYRRPRRRRATPVNDRVYIHEFIDIIGHNRANYMHHMTANWSPIAQAERHQLCYGVWGVVGTTRGWPQVVNIWEEQGFDGLATSFRHEFNHPTLQDPKLAKWWAEAANYRRRGDDRVLVPAPWTPTIEELCAAGVTG